ncbi:tripartite tricarboxylate transporter permease [Microbaculum marinum]|uniref:Tripartite tricarboxylate transporter permease n=1 Tax=Microbaculum marinum TaxID=1764581 RepID=A0AAW9RQE5_9HYPH
MIWEYMAEAFTLSGLMYCFIGVLTGTLVGVLPGVGPAAAMSLLLPITFGMGPANAIIMLAGIYYGSQYGGSTTAILMRIPGEAASVVTCIDGYMMARKGRAGAALGLAAFGSFFGGTIGIAGIVFAAPLFSKVALAFGPPEYFALILLGVLLVTNLSTDPFVKAATMAVLGLFAGAVGIDLISGENRFTMGTLTLTDGISISVAAIGLFGIGEVLSNLLDRTAQPHVVKTSIRSLFPNREEWRRSAKPMARGTVLGFFMGILPGGGAVMASLTSYALEKRLSDHKEEFGRGAVEGLSGPETANNAATAGAFIPLLTFGLPSNVVMALLLGALQIHGVQPGPAMIEMHPHLFWSVIASMYIGNVFLMVLNLPLIGLWVQLLRISYTLLFPIIIVGCVVGAYTVSQNEFDILIIGVLGVFAYIMRQLSYDIAPFIFGLVLSPLMENAFRQSLLMSRGSPQIFVERPISAALIALAAIVLCFPLMKRVVGKSST